MFGPLSWTRSPKVFLCSILVLGGCSVDLSDLRAPSRRDAGSSRDASADVVDSGLVATDGATERPTDRDTAAPDGTGAPTDVSQADRDLTHDAVEGDLPCANGDLNSVGDADAGGDVGDDDGDDVGDDDGGVTLALDSNDNLPVDGLTLSPSDADVDGTDDCVWADVLPSDDAGDAARFDVSVATDGGTEVGGTDLSTTGDGPAHVISEFSVTSAGDAPWFIAVGPDHNLWFTEHVGSKIGRLVIGGDVTEFEIPTADSVPECIVAGPDGALWFTENGGNKIGRVTTDGSFGEFNVPTANSALDGIALGSDGNIWFTEFNTGRIGRITTAGTITEYALAVGSEPARITPGPDNVLWFTQFGNGKLGRFTPTTPTAVAIFNVTNVGTAPSGIVLGLDGNLWFVDTGTNRIGRSTPTGIITEFPIPTTSGLATRGSITPDLDGNLWFTEFGGNKIGRITPAGVVTEFQIPSAGGAPNGIVTGPDGNIWFAETGTGKLGRITP